MINLARYKKVKIDPQAEPHVAYCYSIFDRAAGFFNPVYTTQSAPEQQLMNEKRAAMNGVYHYPNDLVLYLVGIFDTNTGSFRDSNSYEVGSLYIGDFARKEYKNDDVSHEN